jgi:hypothetical protein
MGTVIIMCQFLRLQTQFVIVTVLVAARVRIAGIQNEILACGEPYSHGGFE